MELILPIKRFWIILKIIYLYLCFWFGALMGDENFYMMKANYLVELNWFDRAIINYKKALRDSKNHHIYSMLGYCYSRMGDHNEAADNYRKAYKRIPDPNINLGLAISEYEIGNIDKSEEIIQDLQDSNYHLESSAQHTIMWLEEKIAVVRRERDKLKH